MRHRVRTGLDSLLLSERHLAALRSRRVGVLAHCPSVTREYVHIIDALIARGIRPRRLFGPEHGLRGEAQDMISVDSGVDPLSGIETVSLYGARLESLRPEQHLLSDLDVMLIDIQDVGSRYYTYVYTALFLAEACTSAGVEVWILDRPNPIGGEHIEGPPVDVGFESFVGALPLPNRHGLTPAEVLRFAQRQGRKLEFEVFEVEGWNRTMWMDEHDAPWVMPSPNMPTLDTATVYPGMCLLEGTNVSEGRGTTRPFELFGAPWIDAAELQASLQKLELPGVAFRLSSITPTFQKHAGRRCSGLQLHVLDRKRFDALRTGAAITWGLSRLGGGFAWRDEAYEFVREIPAIDLLFGSTRQREAIEGACEFEELRCLLACPSELEHEVVVARLPQYDQE